jgi:hypothetical protein
MTVGTIDGSEPGAALGFCNGLEEGTSNDRALEGTKLGEVLGLCDCSEDSDEKGASEENKLGCADDAAVGLDEGGKDGRLLRLDDGAELGLEIGRSVVGSPVASKANGLGLMLGLCDGNGIGVRKETKFGWTEGDMEGLGNKGSDGKRLSVALACTVGLLVGAAEGMMWGITLRR